MKYVGIGCLGIIVILLFTGCAGIFIASVADDSDGSEDTEIVEESTGSEDSGDSEVEESEVEESEVEESEEVEEEGEIGINSIASEKKYVYNVELIEDDYTYGTDEDIQVFSPDGEEHYRIEMEHHSSLFGSDNLDRIQELTEDINDANAEYDYLVFEIVRFDKDEDERWVYTRYNKEQSEQIVSAKEIEDEVFEENADFYENGKKADIGYGEMAINYDDMTPNEMVEYAIENTFGEDLINKDINQTDYGMNVAVKVDVGLSWSESTALSSMKRDIASFIGGLHGYDIAYNNVSVTYQAGLVDDAGNESVDDVLVTEFNDDTIKRINPENKHVYQENLEGLSERWWIHPAFR